jgi:hypothetical protein
MGKRGVIRTFEPPKPGEEILLPLHYRVRSYQAPFWAAMNAGVKRALLVWHRRAGKDLTALNWLIWSMFQRPGTYNYFFPTYKLGKRILWDGMQADGRSFMSHFPTNLIVAKNETEMKITLRVGDGHTAGCPDPTRCHAPHSIFQIVGADECDQTVPGTNPVGCVYSEYSIMDPKAWDLTRPILRENGGWAVFVYTPRGKNHGYTLWKNASRDRREWYVSKLSVEQTRRDAAGELGNFVVDAEGVMAERKSGMAEELIQQEFFCSFEGAVAGAYYADQIRLAYEQGRVGHFEWNPQYMVDTAWDLGRDDATAIWFTQTIAGRLNFIDYIESSTHGLDWYFALLRQRPYKYNRHYVPHDAKVHEYSTNKTRVQFAAEHGFHFDVVPKLSVEDGINAGRIVMAQSRFDDTEIANEISSEHAGKSVLYEGCARGLASLASYQREFDDDKATWKGEPLRNWATHGADAYRYRAVAFHGDVQRGPDYALLGWNPHGRTEQTHAEIYAPEKRQTRVFGQGVHEQVEADYGDPWWR